MGEDEPGFWDHLHELRKYLIRSFLLFVALFVLAFSFREWLFDGFLFRLMDPDFPIYRWLIVLAEWTGLAQQDEIIIGFQLISTRLAGQFMAHISLSAIAAFVLALPFLVFQLWLFVKPALYPHERKVVARGAIIIVGLFLVGSAFAYFILTPLSILFLGNYQVSPLVSNTITIDSYVGTFTSTLFLTGLVFELPVVLTVLARLGFVNSGTLRKARRFALVIGLIVSAIITPTTDPFTMIIVAIPLYLLFELSIMAVSSREKKRGSKNHP